MAANVLVLLLATPAGDGRKVESIEASADGYLEPPVERTQFLASRRALASAARSCASSRAPSNAELERFSHAAASRNLEAQIATVKADIAVDGALPLVHGDQILLPQLLQNLLANMRAYRTAQPPRIRIGRDRARPTDMGSRSRTTAWAFSAIRSAAFSPHSSAPW